MLFHHPPGLRLFIDLAKLTCPPSTKATLTHLPCKACKPFYSAYTPNDKVWNQVYAPNFLGIASLRSRRSVKAHVVKVSQNRGFLSISPSKNTDQSINKPLDAPWDIRMNRWLESRTRVNAHAIPCSPSVDDWSTHHSIKQLFCPEGLPVFSNNIAITPKSRVGHNGSQWPRNCVKSGILFQLLTTRIEMEKCLKMCRQRL